MSRDSRFDKLEQERRVDADAKPSSPSVLSRFDAHEPVVAQVSETVASESLKRFEHDGGAGLHLDRDALAELPMLQCPRCYLDSSKWDVACIHCQTSLTSAEAVAYNLQLVEARRLSQETELEVAREKREAAISEKANEQAAKILDEARQVTQAEVFRRRLISLAVALPAFALTWAVDSYVAKMFFFFIFVMAMGSAVRSEGKPS